MLLAAITALVLVVGGCTGAATQTAEAHDSPGVESSSTPTTTAAAATKVSAAIIASIGASTKLHMDFGANWNGGPFGIPYVVVPARPRPL